ncbi:CaiB/BaiF CoA transferase family protein [Nocardioides deserti]|uniref:CoA transferase n=1 Tax=Nocardioides deserti TaxID=1588644 RepID=A0ABR6UC22_9ACTN|nr:CaiB/BaiF CoA-transferase family protein [Nocardioides deserti]MBC2961977.1 CoA transferase [Nocardioides deserti]GGO70659.1 CoA transferase [Nocardioides deserti]
MTGEPGPLDGGWPAGEARPGPLSGVRVLDLTRILAGPYATMNLADLGADVIKVESPSRGDETRHWGPPFAADGTASYFMAVNHNKRSVALDLASAAGARVARRLAAHADVVIDNFLPGRMEAFGLDRAAIARDNPRVVTATISGFGSDNAYAGRPGFDFLAQAMGGLMSITGAKGGSPTRVGVAVTDLFAGVFAALGIVSSLSERDRTGRGRHVEISLLDAQISMLANMASGWLVAGKEPALFGNQHPSIAPYETLATADEPIAVAVGTDRHFRRFAAALGAPELGNDPRFADNRGRVTHRDELVAELESRLRTGGRGHWLDVLESADVPVAPVNTIPEVFADPVISERMVVDVDGVPQVRTPLRLDGAALEITSGPPQLGADTAAVLQALGVSQEMIREMRPDGATS